MFKRLILLKKIISGNHTICVLPWLSLNILRNCKVFHCCFTSDFEKFAGDLTGQTIEEIWNGDYMKSIRKSMINGQEHALCSRCYEIERHSGTSIRFHNNIFYRLKLFTIPFITKPDGSLSKVDIQYWDIRFSNICNYKCRICAQWNSTSWIPDSKKMGLYHEDADPKPVFREQMTKLINWILEPRHLKSVKKIYFSGGEPLLMEEHWKLLEELDKRHKYSIILSYNTNLGTLSYKNKSILDYWKKWDKNVEIWTSIDETGERAELIRSGTKWENVEKNIKTLVKQGIFIKTAITVNAMNVFRIPEIIERLVQLGVIGMTSKEPENWRNFFILIVEEPKKLHVSILPEDFRQSIRKKLEDYINEYEHNYGVSIRDLFITLFWHLEKPWDRDNLGEFIKFTNDIDAIREENTFEVIPELKCLLGEEQMNEQFAPLKK